MRRYASSPCPNLSRHRTTSESLLSSASSPSLGLRLAQISETRWFPVPGPGEEGKRGTASRPLGFCKGGREGLQLLVERPAVAGHVFRPTVPGRALRARRRRPGRVGLRKSRGGRVSRASTGDRTVHPDPGRGSPATVYNCIDKGN